LLLHPNNISNIRQVVLLDKGIQHVDKNQQLSNCHLHVSLPISRVVGAEALLQQGVNVTLKNPSQLDGVFFEVVKQTNCIQEGAVVHLSAKLNSLALRIDVALPYVVEDVMWFNGIARNKYHKQGLIDHVQGKMHHQQLEFTLDRGAVRTARGEVEA
jgi:hypothetical protein